MLLSERVLDGFGSSDGAVVLKEKRKAKRDEETKGQLEVSPSPSSSLLFLDPRQADVDEYHSP